MLASFLADVVVVVHLAFVLFVVAGGWLAWRRPACAALHLPAVAWGVLVEVQSWLCPLTHLENALRRQAGAAGYEGGFVAHYLLPVLYPPGLSRGTQLVLAALVVAVNAAVYGAMLGRHWRRDAT